MRYKSFFQEDSKLIDPQSIENEISQLTDQLDGFQKELQIVKIPELRDELEQKIYYIQHQIYDLQRQAEDLKGENE